MESGKDTVQESHQTDDCTHKFTSAPSTQSVYAQLQVGPIARMTFCRETDVDGDEDAEAIPLQAGQLLTVPARTWALTEQYNYEQPPSLDQDLFSPYSPGFFTADTATTIVFNPEYTQLQRIGLNEYCSRANFRPKEDEEDEDSDEEEIREDHVEAERVELVEEKREKMVAVVVGETEKTKTEVMTVVEATKAAEEFDEEQVMDVFWKYENSDGNVKPVINEDATEVQDFEQSVTAEIEAPASSTNDTSEQSDTLTMGAKAAQYLKIMNPDSDSTTKCPPMERHATESEEIAKQWRQDQSASLIIHRHDRSNIEHTVHHETLNGSKHLTRRPRTQASQSRHSSNASIQISTGKTDQFSSRSSMALSSSESGHVASSQRKTAALSSLGEQTAMSEDNVSIPASGASIDGNTALSLATQQQDESVSPAGSSNTPSSNAIQCKKPTRIDTSLPRRVKAQGIATTALSEKHPPTLQRRPSIKFLARTISTATLGFVGNQEEQRQEQIVSSKVSRSGKLFATKTKTIAGFEYTTSNKLGKGNFGIVYHGKWKNGGDLEVAIKKITRKLPGEIEKLGLVQREMRVCRMFRNKTGIVRLMDIITTNKHHYLIFEKAEGDLAEMIRSRLKNAADAKSSKDLHLHLAPSASCFIGDIFKIQEIRDMMRPVVLGTQALHHEGYSHKDIKPANILYRDREGMLCDFGLCSQAHELPRTQFFGTQDYAAPEARRAGGPRAIMVDYMQSDIYSLGAVFYELATGAVLSKVISQGLNYAKMAHFGGESFSELLRGMVEFPDRRWSIDQVVNSRFWSESSSSAEPVSTAEPCRGSSASHTHDAIGTQWVKT
ncbi:hypothetical protein BGZ50_002934 [Haplosporangium sp. Z 11]|nr:hypothetical protein BGZ50_002934 [Haplosporangium sp. Z 11]